MKNPLLFLSIWTAMLSVPLDTYAAGLAYRETFDAESVFPTTPEVDSFSMGTLLEFGGPIAPTFSNDGLIHALATNGFNGSIQRVSAAFPDALKANMSTAGSDLVVRGVFSLQGIAGIGISGVGVRAQLYPSGHQIRSGLAFDSTTFPTSVSLRVSEADASTITEVATDSLALPASFVTSLLATSSFTMELRFDAASQSSTAWLSVDGSEFETGPILLVAPTGQTLDGIIEAAGTTPSGFGPNSFDAEVETFELEVDSAAFPPLLNLDIGDAQGVPAPGFAAAGFPGTWNVLDLRGPQALVNVWNHSIAATADVFAVSTAQSTLGAGPLKGDRLAHCGVSNWRVDFANLEDGAYRVLVYAPADGSPTHDMEIEGTLFTSLPGEPGTALTEGISWGWELAAVEGGNLTIEEMPGGVCNSGLSGIQIEGPVTVPEPSLGALLASGVTGLALGGALRRSVPSCSG